LLYGPDSAMAATARDASSKIAAVLPKARRAEMEAVGLFVIPRMGEAPKDHILGTLRRALREERQVWLGYRDKSGALSERTVCRWRSATSEITRGWSPGARSGTTIAASANCRA